MCGICETHLNSSNGKVVLGGRPGLNETIRKNIEKLMMNEPNFLINPIVNLFSCLACCATFHH